MTYKMGDCEIEVKGEVTNIAFGTTADYAYRQYLAKKKMIADLEYECELLVDKYHSEMRSARIPGWFDQDYINYMFNEEDQKSRNVARKHFLTCCFSPAFLEKHKVEFVRMEFGGYHHTWIGVVLGIGHFEYTVKLPQPKNIWSDEDKERLVGEVQFRVDRIHKSKLKEFVKEMEAVQMPTYDWKECFKAIETIVAKEK